MPERVKTTAKETDAFSRKSRGLIHWGRGELKKLKRAYAKRVRQTVKHKQVEKPE